jgi:dTMP kinase
VIIDRYYYSGCVYSAAKLNPTLDLTWARHPEVGLPRPDLCVFLDISTEEAAKRGGYGLEKYEQQEMQVQVRRLFNELMASKDGEDFVRIDAGRPLDEVKAAVAEAVSVAMEKVDREERPLRIVAP